jgi:hypothetical protein
MPAPGGIPINADARSVTDRGTVSSRSAAACVTGHAICGGAPDMDIEDASDAHIINIR